MWGPGRKTKPTCGFPHQHIATAWDTFRKKRAPSGDGALWYRCCGYWMDWVACDSFALAMAAAQVGAAPDG